MGAAGDTLSNIGGGALGTLALLDAAHSGNLFSVLAQRQKLLGDPQFRASLQDSPFAAGQFGVFGGRGPVPVETTGVMAPGSPPATQQAWIPNLPALPPGVEAVNAAMQAAQQNPADYDTSISMDAEGRPAIIMRPKLPATDWTQLLGGGPSGMQVTGASIPVSGRGGSVTIGPPPGARAEATAAAREGASERENVRKRAIREAELRKSGVTLPGSVPPSSAPIALPSVAPLYPSGAPPTGVPPEIPATYTPPISPLAPGQPTAIPKGAKTEEGITYAIPGGKAAETAAAAEVGGLPGPGALRVSNLQVIADASKWLRDFAASDPETLSEFIGPLASRKMARAQQLGLLSPEMADKYAQFQSNYGVVYEALFERGGTQLAEHEMKILQPSFPLETDAQLETFRKKSELLLHKVTKLVSHYAKASAYRVPPETRADISAAVQRGNEPAPNVAPIPPGRSQIPAILGGVGAGILANRLGGGRAGRLIGPMIGAALGGEGARQVQGLSGPAPPPQPFTDMLINGLFPAAGGEAFSMAAPAFRAIGEAIPAGGTGMAGLASGLGRLATNVGERFAGAGTPPLSPTLYNRMLGEVWQNATPVGRTLLNRIAKDPTQLQKLVASTTGVKELIKKLGPDAAGILMRASEGISRSVGPFAGRQAIFGGLSTPLRPPSGILPEPFSRRE